MTLTLAQQLREIQLKYNGPIPAEEQAKIDRLMNPPKGSRLASQLRYAEVRVWAARKRQAKKIPDRIERNAEIQKVEHWLYPAFTDWQKARQEEIAMQRAAE